MMELAIPKGTYHKFSSQPQAVVDENIQVLDGKNLSYGDFFENYMFRNRPCLIKNVSNNWEATSKWVVNGRPNIEYLNYKYKDTNAIIYNCSERYFNSQKCIESTLGEYVKLWKQVEQEGIYYLKDWHLKLQCPEDTFYEVPIYFASDWLNEYFIHCTDDDYRFVYVGQKGSWTPLHIDVFNSFSWSVNICGQKQWIFFPPGEESQLKDNLNNIFYDIKNAPEIQNSLELIQNDGEAVFVPSGWYHQVWNLEDTISINHNWVNGCNISTMWDSLKTSLKIIENEIKDCRDMDNFDEQCQTILKVHFGIDYNKFYKFLTFIGQRRIDMLNNKLERKMFYGHGISSDHIIFDLVQICAVIQDFLNCDYANGKFVEGQSFVVAIKKSIENIV
ncbi:2-oxoglutarate and iron-dependent oxygenase JMJD4 [Euwallacea fornicatus]|uniref:2-oxoglutarate and iron-dependent oxygenase JMJD4 n=1 Tax=Euwallacea fornicatus TaxID=995702 RepID=UPI00338E8123